MSDSKNIFILGDSYSTFKGYIPDGYLSWYSGRKSEATDVVSVTQTWWWQLIDSTDSHLVRNDSWSGTTICNTCRPTLDISTSFINRFEKLVNDGFFEQNEIDAFLIFGGTNDCWIDAPKGELIFNNWKEADLFNILPAVSYLYYRVKKVIPKAKIITIINTELNEIVTDGMKKAADYFGIKYIQLRNISKQEGHPDVKGMSQIKEQVAEYLKCDS